MNEAQITIYSNATSVSNFGRGYFSAKLMTEHHVLATDVFHVNVGGLNKQNTIIVRQSNVYYELRLVEIKRFYELLALNTFFVFLYGLKKARNKRIEACLCVRTQASVA